jgi:hypothetical protein
MENATLVTPVASGDLQPWTGRTVNRRLAARIAGAGYVALFALALFANFFVLEGLVESEDAAATVANIQDDLGLFQMGLIAFLLVFVLDIAISWALYVVFRDVHRDLALLAAWSRLVYTVFLGVALVYFFQVIQWVGDAGYVAALGPDQVQAQTMLALDSFEFTWLVGLVAFGLHLVLLGALVLRSGYVPRVLGALLILAGAAYAIDTVAHAVLSDYDAVAGLMLALVALPSMVGEGWLGLWLLLTRRFNQESRTG